MKIAICDDKEIFHNELKKHLEKYAADRGIIIVYDDYLNGLELVASNIDYDIIFMDYQMDGMDGLETSKHIRKKNKKTAIIFLTSFPDIVFDTFEVNAYRFLVKPINMEKLSVAMDDFIQSLENDDYIFLKMDENNKRVDINDIIYVEAADKYCYIRTEDENMLYKNTLSEIEKMLPADKFFRSHRTYLVGFRHIISHTSTDILFDNKEKALISKLKFSAFKKAFTGYVKRYSFIKG